MCKEDIRIARKKRGQQTAAGSFTLTGDMQLIARANPNRTALALAWQGTPDLVFGNIVIGTRPVSAGIFAGMSQDQTGLLLRLEDYGDLILGPVYAKQQGISDAELYVSEVQLLEPLSDL